MSKVEEIRQRVSGKILPIFNDVDYLHTSCLVQTPIIADCSLRMCYGMRMVTPGKEVWINGTYGTKKFDKLTKEVVARCGFDIEKNEMVIRHTPQANRPEQFSSNQVRNRLGRSDFR